MYERVLRLLLQLIMVLSSSVVVNGHAMDQHRVQPLKRIFWMHIQKTSSWIGDLLLRWSCPGIDDGYGVNPEEKVFLADRVRYNLSSWKCDSTIITSYDHYGHHIPYDPDIAKGAVITVFRKPIDRIISAFLFADGMHIPRGHPLGDLENEVRANLSKTTHPMISYANFLGIPHCQSKMVMGYHCGEDVRGFSKSELDIAYHRLHHEFAFVGLTEEPEATYNLFRSMFGEGHLLDKPHMLPPHRMNYRKNEQHNDWAQKHFEGNLRKHRWVDQPDEFVYSTAKTLFYQRCKEHGVQTEYGGAGEHRSIS